MDEAKFWKTLRDFSMTHIELQFKQSEADGTPVQLQNSLLMLLISTLTDLSTTMYEMSDDITALTLAVEAIKKEYCGE